MKKPLRYAIEFQLDENWITINLEFGIHSKYSKAQMQRNYSENSLHRQADGDADRMARPLCKICNVTIKFQHFLTIRFFSYFCRFICQQSGMDNLTIRSGITIGHCWFIKFGQIGAGTSLLDRFVYARGVTRRWPIQKGDIHRQSKSFAADTWWRRSTRNTGTSLASWQFYSIVIRKQQRIELKWCHTHTRRMHFPIVLRGEKTKNNFEVSSTTFESVIRFV